MPSGPLSSEAACISQSDEPPPATRRFELWNIHPNASVAHQDLKDFGREAGNISFADIDRDTPGQGILEYMTRDDADHAVKTLDGKDLRGQSVRVALAPGGGDDRGYEGGGGRDRYRDDRHRDDREDRYRARSRSPPRRDSYYDRDRRPRSPPRRERSPPRDYDRGRYESRRDDREREPYAR